MWQPQRLLHEQVSFHERVPPGVLQTNNEIRPESNAVLQSACLYGGACPTEVFVLPGALPNRVAVLFVSQVFSYSFL